MWCTCVYFTYILSTLFHWRIEQQFSLSLLKKKWSSFLFFIKKNYIFILRFHKQTYATSTQTNINVYRKKLFLKWKTSREKAKSQNKDRRFGGQIHILLTRSYFNPSRHLTEPLISVFCLTDQARTWPHLRRLKCESLMTLMFHIGII